MEFDSVFPDTFEKGRTYLLRSIAFGVSSLIDACGQTNRRGQRQCTYEWLLSLWRITDRNAPFVHAYISECKHKQTLHSFTVSFIGVGLFVDVHHATIVETCYLVKCILPYNTLAVIYTYWLSHTILHKQKCGSWNCTLMCCSSIWLLRVNAHCVIWGHTYRHCDRNKMHCATVHIQH